MRKGFSFVELLITLIILAVLVGSVIPIISSSHKITRENFIIDENSPHELSSVNDAVVKANAVLEFLSKIHTNSTCLEGNYTCNDTAKAMCCGIYRGDPGISVSVVPYNGTPNVKLIIVRTEFKDGNYTVKQVVGIWK